MKPKLKCVNCQNGHKSSGRKKIGSSYKLSDLEHDSSQSKVYIEITAENNSQSKQTIPNEQELCLKIPITTLLSTILLHESNNRNNISYNVIIPKLYANFVVTTLRYCGNIIHVL